MEQQQRLNNWIYIIYSKRYGSNIPSLINNSDFSNVIKKLDHGATKISSNHKNNMGFIQKHELLGQAQKENINQ